MKKLAFLFCLPLLLSCDALTGPDPEIVICPEPPHMIFTFTVDYTTNKFLGGYTISLPEGDQLLEMACEYKSPGDFGSIKWYDKASDTELFGGTIVWMGKGRQTYPEEVSPPGTFVKLKVTTDMPKLTRLYHDEFDALNEKIDYTPIWQAIEKLQSVSWATQSTPAYIYLYHPSVGAGNPKDWYWVIFLEYSAYSSQEPAGDN